MAGATELEAFADLADSIANDAEAQLVFSRSRPTRSLEACDAELDQTLDKVAILAKCIAEVARFAIAFTQEKSS